MRIISPFKRLFYGFTIGVSSSIIIYKRIQNKKTYTIPSFCTVYAEESTSNSLNERIKLSTVIDYENKIRLYSPPEKVFRYFASKRHYLNHNEIYMTLDDFLRSYMLNIISNKDNSLDIYNNIDPKKYQPDLLSDSIFFRISNNGLINYYDFLFLMTILSTDERHLEVVFNTIDINNDGVISKEEFINALFIFLKKSVFGKKYGKLELEAINSNMNKLNIIKKVFSNSNEATATTIATIPDDPIVANNSSGVTSRYVPIGELIEFCKLLKMEISRLEFDYFQPKNGKITEENFAMLIISSSKSMMNQWYKIRNRINRRYESIPTNERGVSFEQYKIFCQFLERISLVNVALEFCRLNGENIDKPIFKHIVKSLVNAVLDDHVIDVIFTIFDENGDQLLSNDEFTQVMKNRSERGFKRLKDTGMSSFMETLYQCAKNKANTIQIFK